MTTLPLRTTIAATTAAFAACILLVAPSHADAIKSGSNAPTTKPTSSVVKGIDSPGSQSGGVKSAPFDPVTVTFPKTTQRGAQPASGQAFRAGGERRK